MIALGAFDTETGGLKAELNPLLSASMIFADDAFNEVAQLSFKLLPPPGTVIEVPTPETQRAGCFAKKIAYYADVLTGQRYEKAEATGVKFIITAVAAEINGYITFGPDGLWDLQHPPAWHLSGLTYEAAEAEFLKAIDCAVGPEGKIQLAAHNAPFDAKYLAQYMPRVFARVSEWVDTCAMLKKWRASTKQAGRNRLDDLCELAQYDIAAQRLTHDALCDARGCLRGLQWLAAQG